VIEVTAVGAFAYGGADVAKQRGMDVVGIAVLAVVNGLAGGVLRDMVIGQPVLAIHDNRLLPTCLAASLVVGLFGARLPRGIVDAFDAIGLGMFTILGTQRALNAGTTPVAAVMLGAVTVGAGSVVRDLLAGDRPGLLYRSELYVVLAVTGATVLVIGDRFDIASAPLLVAVAACVTIARLVALRRGWLSHAPHNALPDQNMRDR
jgi:uncharacterized membrane protein YeiH